VALVAPIVLLVSACSSAASQSVAPSPPAAASGSGTSVTAKESEFKIELSATSAAAGPVTFSITNSGTVVHEFVVAKTDLTSDKLPVDSSKGEVNEDDPSLTAVDEVEDIAVGANETLSVDLPAGHYVLFCNVTGHYAGGMHADFTTN
jgi:uncharacterized cupredoxin-like copper-binding protein